MCEPAGKAGVGIGGIVLYRRAVVRQGAVRASAWSGYAGGLDDERRLVGAVVVMGDVGRSRTPNLLWGGISEYELEGHTALLVLCELGSGSKAQAWDRL